MFINTVSTLIAVYGFIVVKDQSVKILSNIHVRQKYLSLQLVLLITGMQRSLIMSIFLTFNLQCEEPLHIESTVDRKCILKEFCLYIVVCVCMCGTQGNLLPIDSVNVVNIQRKSKSKSCHSANHFVVNYFHTL